MENQIRILHQGIFCSEISVAALHLVLMQRTWLEDRMKAPKDGVFWFDRSEVWKKERKLGEQYGQPFSLGLHVWCYCRRTSCNHALAPVNAVQ